MLRKENETTTYQNWWNIIKSVLSGKFMALNIQIRGEERCQINDQFPLQKIKEEQIKLKISRNKYQSGN